MRAAAPPATELISSNLSPTGEPNQLIGRINLSVVHRLLIGPRVGLSPYSCVVCLRSIHRTMVHLHQIKEPRMGNPQSGWEAHSCSGQPFAGAAPC